MVGSMGRVASCGDNAAIESFVSLLQKNVLNRRSPRLGRLTPIEFKAIMNTPAERAA